jgi:hypothetical protein
MGHDINLQEIVQQSLVHKMERGKRSPKGPRVLKETEIYAALICSATVR